MQTVASNLNRNLNSNKSNAANQMTSLLNEINFFKAEKKMYQSAKNSQF